MDITSFIETEHYIIVAVLYIIGIMIKKSKVADKWIPLILGGIGILLVTVYKFTVHLPSDFSEVMQVVYAGVTQGILCASGSVYANNIVKQLKKTEDSEE